MPLSSNEGNMGLGLNLEQGVPCKDPARWLILAGVWLLYAVFGVRIASLPQLDANVEAD